MGVSKWEGGAAIALATSASNEPSSYKYPDAEEASIDGDPIIYKRKPSFLPDVDIARQAGKSYKWSLGNVHCNANLFGYLWRILTGQVAGDVFATGFHTMTPTDDLDYINVLIDRALDLGSSTPTERLIGGKAGDFTFEQQQNDISKLSLSGIGCTKGTAAAALVPVIPTGTDEAPLDWAALKAGYFKIGYNGAATAQDNDITGFKLSGKRNLTPSGISLGSDQPASIRVGARESVSLEIYKEFSGAGALSAYNAWASQQIVQVEFKYLMGTNYVTSGVMTGVVSGSFPGSGVGAGDDLITATLKLDLYKNGATPIYSMLVKDGSSAAYT